MPKPTAGHTNDLFSASAVVRLTILYIYMRAVLNPPIRHASLITMQRSKAWQCLFFCS